MARTDTQSGGGAPITAKRRPPAFSAPRALLRSARPRQWIKNLLVAAVPAAAGASQSSVWRTTAVAFLAFCLVSSGTYLLNDAADVEADRRHPLKRSRPIAAGEVSVFAARAAGVLALAAGLLVSAFVNVRLLGVVGGYVLLTAAYTRYLKHMPVFDIAAVAAGFFLRAVAGGAASDIFISRWFLIVAGAGSLLLICGKRYAELKAAGVNAALTRPVLAQYSTSYLQAMLSTTAGVTVLAYCLWSFEARPHHHPTSWTALSAVPFVLGIMRYGLLLEHGHGEEPEELLSGDRQLQVLSALWVALLAIGALS